MDGIIHIEKALIEIPKLLSKNKNIGKLLVNQKPSALEESTPSNDKVKERIFNTPVVDDPPEAFIVIYYPSSAYTTMDNIMTSALTIDVYVKIEHWTLNDNRLRLYRLIDEVVETLHLKKIYSVGVLEYTAHTLSATDELDGMVGAAMIFGMTDENVI